jgi:hypothetical protein
MLKRIVVLSVGLTLSGCRWAAGPDVNLAIETDRLTYAVDSLGVAVGFRVVNVGEGPVLLARCGERIMAGVERWEGSQWGPSSGDACPATLLMVPLKLEPGDSAWSARSIRDPGAYRLQVYVQSDGSGADQSGPSNTFIVQ